VVLNADVVFQPFLLCVIFLLYYAITDCVYSIGWYNAQKLIYSAVLVAAHMLRTN
jgi:hypothetical protein